MLVYQLWEGEKKEKERRGDRVEGKKEEKEEEESKKMAGEWGGRESGEGEGGGGRAWQEGREAGSHMALLQPQQGEAGREKKP